MNPSYFYDGMMGTREPTAFEISAPVGNTIDRIIEKRTVAAGINDKNIFDVRGIPEPIARSSTMQVMSQVNSADLNQLRSSRAYIDPMSGYSPGMGNFNNQPKGILTQSTYPTSGSPLPIAGFYDPDRTDTLGNLQIKSAGKPTPAQMPKQVKFDAPQPVKQPKMMKQANEAQAMTTANAPKAEVAQQNSKMDQYASGAMAPPKKK